MGSRHVNAFVKFIKVLIVYQIMKIWYRIVKKRKNKSKNYKTFLRTSNSIKKLNRALNTFLSTKYLVKVWVARKKVYEI